MLLQRLLVADPQRGLGHPDQGGGDRGRGRGEGARQGEGRSRGGAADCHHTDGRPGIHSGWFHIGHTSLYWVAVAGDPPGARRAGAAPGADQQQRRLPRHLGPQAVAGLLFSILIRY